MACIGLGTIDTKLIPMVLGCIFCFLNRLLNQYDGTLLTKMPITMNIFISLSKTFTVIPYIIMIFKSRKPPQVTDKEIQKITPTGIKRYAFQNEEKKIVKGKWGFIFLSGILFLFNQFFFALTIVIKSNTSILNILITSLFYYLIFREKLYKHHYVSVVLILSIGFAIDMILGNLQNDITNNTTLFFCRFLRETLYSLSCVIDKYVIEKKFGSVYELALSSGVISLVLLLLFSIFDYNFIGLDDYNKYFENFNFIELLVIFGTLVTQLGINLNILFTNKNTTPCHIFIIFIFGQLAYYVNFSSGTSVIVLIFLLLILFISLIFNEIIEINFWGLSDNTKKNIRKRAESEEFSSINRSDTLNSMLDGKDGYILREKDFVQSEQEEEEKKQESAN